MLIGMKSIPFFGIGFSVLFYLASFFNINGDNIPSYRELNLIFLVVVGLSVLYCFYSRSILDQRPASSRGPDIFCLAIFFLAIIAFLIEILGHSSGEMLSPEELMRVSACVWAAGYSVAFHLVR
mgnify:CR=1 FL=1